MVSASAVAWLNVSFRNNADTILVRAKTTQAAYAMKNMA
eukprot:CAMPEP_0172887074 /NCGR_PEP_ID=MMETSP1075-20121228/132892_1 /TAXON_ID=2916 /ORGANISM="Ceratium fusus, Strain PA161109" /LENGTH=38 /DNA_ID= /DNA_START= /DNA_END= /DNA_ORIENTATION=